ncbi:universal stress protein [Pseudorhodoplanes sp.]|uniref:universal stress protein n=1 Tax=Pseudorhodoplanes sp. TaxID=1934341 RepID=UPI003D09F321
MSYIEAPMLGRIGTTSYKTKLEEALRKQADDARQRLHKIFERECKEWNMSFEWLSFEGDPNLHLQLAAGTRDIIITGHDTAYYGNIREQLPEMVSKLLLATPRPVIICPDEPPAGRDVLIAYDGSLAAMRVIQLFVLLGIGQDSRIHVTSINASRELAERATHDVVDYLNGHEYQAEAHPITSDTHPSDLLRSQVADQNIGTLVMGAYGRRGWREFLFGSTTNSLVGAPPCALFLYH